MYLMRNHDVWIYVRCANSDPRIAFDRLYDLIDEAAGHGFLVRGTSFDHCSGNTLKDRIGLRTMLDAVENGRIEAVMVRDLEQISRNSYILVGVIEILRQNDVYLITTECDLNAELINSGLERFVNIAKYEADWGYHEDNENNITPYGQWYGLNGNAWCAMFVSWCAHYAGITDTLVPKYSWCPSGVSWYKSKGRYHVSGNGYVPKIGDIIFFYNAQAGRVSHTGIVIDGTTTHVSTIEGNSSDGVRHKIYNLTDSSIDGYGDNGGTPIHSNKPHATEDEINLKMKEYFHDLLLPLGVDEEITDGILKNGLSIPSGIPGLTFSVTLNQDITLENNGKYLSIENGELVLEQDAIENLSIILAHITPSTYDTIISTLNTFAFSFNNEICKTFFSINAVEKQLEFGLQVSKNVQILDGVSREVVVEYKITYKISDKNTPQEVALYDSLNEINTNISTINNKQVSTYLLIFIIIIFFVFCSKIPIAINGPLEVCAQIIEGIDNFNNI